MGTVTERLVFLAVAIVLAIALAPWKLDWWLTDTVIAMVVFLFGAAYRDNPMSFGFAWLQIGIAGALFALAYWVAEANGLRVVELQGNFKLARYERRLPDFAVIFLVLGCLTMLATSLFVRRRHDI